MADSTGLTLLALGTAGAYRAHPGARGSGYLVRLGEHCVVLDLGHGAYVPLAAEIGIGALAGLDAVCVTHLHPDHIGGIAGLAQSGLADDSTWLVAPDDERIPDWPVPGQTTRSPVSPRKSNVRSS